jgi:cytochrome c oxidase subunit 3
MTDIVLNKDKQLSTIGLLIAMASIVMLFGTFVSSFYVLKIRLISGLYLPNSIIHIGWFNTFILLGTSISFTFAGKKYRQNNTNGFDLLMTVTITGGLFFILGQFYLWSELTRVGFPITSGQLLDMFYLISGVHGIHILSGLGALIWLQLSERESYSYSRIHHVGIFWHFLGFLWVVLFAAILY